jgi:dUTP pyrophosphatase
MQIRPRSGVTLKTKLRVQLGTVDSGYRGEIGVIVDNTHRGNTGMAVKRFAFYIDGKFANNESEHGTYIVRKGDRIAQAVIAPFETCHFVDSDKLEESMRGGQGFGSSGVK